MPENRASETRSHLTPAPAALTLLGGDAAGVCTDGYCALPAASEPESAASEPAGAEDADAGATEPVAD